MRFHLAILSLALLVPDLALAMCPAGFLEVESQDVPLGCIQQAEENALATQSWLSASADCQATYGGRLPTFQEWWLARNSLLLVDDGTDREWTADVHSISLNETAIAVRPDPGPTVLDSIAMEIASGSAEFRCWIPAQGLFVSWVVPALSLSGGAALAGALLFVGRRVRRRNRSVARDPARARGVAVASP